MRFYLNEFTVKPYRISFIIKFWPVFFSLRVNVFLIQQSVRLQHNRSSSFRLQKEAEEKRVRGKNQGKETEKSQGSRLNEMKLIWSLLLSAIIESAAKKTREIKKNIKRGKNGDKKDY